MSTVAVILAAGASMRLGRPKQLVSLPNGQTLLQHAIASALAAGVEEAIVVLGANAERIRPTLETTPATVVINDAWVTGPGSSLHRGIRAAAGATRVLVMTCDQPMIDFDHLRRLIAAAETSPDGASGAAYDGAIGVPACFDRRHFGSLLALDPSAGAARFLRSLPEAGQVPMPEAAFDVDRAADLHRLAARGGGGGG